jgi:hypothetical protein
MIRRLRLRHRRMILIVTVACLIVFTVALLARTPARRNPILPALHPAASPP